MIPHKTNLGIETQQNQIAFLLKMTDLEDHAASRAEDYVSRRDILFQNSGTADKMLELLKHAVLPDNVYQIQYLDTAYQNFTKKESVQFSLKDLFNEGWLIACQGEWLFNIKFKSSYEKIEHLPTEKETQVLSFLKELSQLPYRSQLWLRAPDDAECKGTEGILKDINGEFFLDPYGTCWTQLGDAVFGKWWDEIIETEDPKTDQRDAQIEYWFSCWAVFSHCWTPDFYCSHTEELFEECLKKLERELENTSWEFIEKIFHRRVFLEFNPQGNIPYSQFMKDYPDNLTARILYLNEDTHFNLTDIPERLRRICQMCLRQYSNVNRKQRLRFRKCMQNPWTYLYFYSLTADLENIQFLTDCLGYPYLFVPAVLVIWNMIHDFIRKSQSIGEKFLEELDQNLFGILSHGLEWENEEEWLSAVQDTGWYLNEKSGWYCKTGNMRKTGMQKYLQCIHKDYLAWYEKNILPDEQMHKKILEYFYTEFEASSERNIVKAFAGYTVLAGMQQTQAGAEKLFGIYQKFLKRVQTEDTIISVLPWSFWLEKSWIFMVRETASSKKQSETGRNIVWQLYPAERYPYRKCRIHQLFCGMCQNLYT